MRRIAEQIKKEVARILKTELKDPRVGFVSVTEVELSRDLRYAKVYVSIYGDNEAQKEAMEGLARATSFIRREIGQQLSLRYVPEITFKLDASIAQGIRISRLLRDVSPGAERKEENGAAR